MICSTNLDLSTSSVPSTLPKNRMHLTLPRRLPLSYPKTSTTSHFGLINAPRMFQCLMDRAPSRFNPEDGPDYVTVCTDDVIAFSRTLEEHLKHQCHVIQRIRDAGLKLKPSKCHFIRDEYPFLHTLP